MSKRRHRKICWGKKEWPSGVVKLYAGSTPFGLVVKANKNRWEFWIGNETSDEFYSKEDAMRALEIVAKAFQGILP